MVNAATSAVARSAMNSLTGKAQVIRQGPQPRRNVFKNIRGSSQSNRARGSNSYVAVTSPRPFVACRQNSTSVAKANAYHDVSKDSWAVPAHLDEWVSAAAKTPWGTPPRPWSATVTTDTSSVRPRSNSLTSLKSMTSVL